MPITKSAIKALRKDKRKTKINKSIRSKLKTALKKVKQEPTAKNLNLAYSCLDRASKKKVIHKNKASRLKSKLTNLVNQKLKAKS